LRNIFRQKLVSVFLAASSKINFKYPKDYGVRKFVNHVIIPKISTFFLLLIQLTGRSSGSHSCCYSQQRMCRMANIDIGNIYITMHIYNTMHFSSSPLEKNILLSY
jgi:hypothetical protein